MNDSIYKTISNCRVCGKDQLNNILDLGEHPPANSLRKDLDESLPLVPLSLIHCENCKTVQLRDTVKPEFLFRKYVWVTGTSSMANSHSIFFCEEALKRLSCKQPFIVEVASNDGTFLKRFKDKGFKVLGVDPAKNIAQMANDRGIPTLPEFFSKKIATSIIEKNGLADCIYARNVIPHVENIHDITSGMTHCIKDEGMVIIEFHYGANIIAQLQYDSIYHEHIFYFSLQSLCFLLGIHGLWAFDFNVSPISGGSITLYCTKNKRPRSTVLEEKLKEEKSLGLNLKNKWLEFAKGCIQHKRILNELVKPMADNGLKFIGYGASARSSTLLNFCEIDNRYLTCIADGNSLKHGMFTAGTDIPVVSPDDAFVEKPDAVLLLGWNFKEEILPIIRDKYQFHGKVVLPFPNNPQIIEI